MNNLASGPIAPQGIIKGPAAEVWRRKVSHTKDFPTRCSQKGQRVFDLSETFLEIFWGLSKNQRKSQVVVEAFRRERIYISFYNLYAGQCKKLATNAGEQTLILVR